MPAPKRHSSSAIQVWANTARHATTRLHCAGLVVSVVNPAQARSLDKGWGMLSKIDLIDALRLAQYEKNRREQAFVRATCECVIDSNVVLQGSVAGFV